MSKTYSTPEQVQKSYDFLNNIPKPSCPGCSRGIRMCYHTPCIGTPKDMAKLLDAGYANNLMLDLWLGSNSRDSSIKKSFGVSKPDNITNDDIFIEDVIYLAPALVGYEGKKAPFAKHGKCNLLIDNQCSLHDKGLKPAQGSYACCKIDNVWIDENGNEQEIDERLPIIHTWNTQEGRNVISRWKSLVSYSGDENSNCPSSFPEMISALLSVFEAQVNLMETNPTDGRPAYDPDEKIESIKNIYEKPY